MDRTVGLARTKKVFGGLTTSGVFMRLKDEPIASRILETLLVKTELKEHIEVIICSEIFYISATLRIDNNAKLIAAARSEYIATISDDETTTYVYLAKLQ